MRSVSRMSTHVGFLTRFGTLAFASSGRFAGGHLAETTSTHLRRTPSSIALNARLARNRKTGGAKAELEREVINAPLRRRRVECLVGRPAGPTLGNTSSRQGAILR